MGDPKNSVALEGGARAYEWVDAETGERTLLLSVTSIRRMCGEPASLVSWQLANICDVALNTVKRTVIGPRGGVSEKRVVQNAENEFLAKLIEADGKQAPTDELRRWLRGQADEPRNIAAARGTIVHEAIELGIGSDHVEREYVEAAFKRLSARDRKRREGVPVADEDVLFVHHGVRQYEDMRAHVPFVILAREVQVWNLTVGYGGTADVFLWFLGQVVDDAFVPFDWATDARVAELQRIADRGQITQEFIEETGGFTGIGDWKTSADLHTDNVVQVIAYSSAEFVGNDGVKDARLTTILQAMMGAAVIHVRPNKWGVYIVEYADKIVGAFLGSVMFARFLAMHPKPTDLFIASIEGSAE